jgi:regulator of PEP synthase PpsR (kinase-PPPase family)
LKIERTVFFISDGTGITAGALGQLLAHFPQTHFTQVRLPFTDCALSSLCRSAMSNIAPY